jgi:putative transposase
METRGRYTGFDSRPCLRHRLAMARISRVVIPGVPHHVTQRGNRRLPTFFGDDDYRSYRELLAEGCKAAQVEVLAWCLMPNHVHLVLTPSSEGGLRAALADAHRRYSRRINQREGWTGYLWQGRFASAPMDEDHRLAACRYVELNPVRARLVAAPEDWPWSSARAHLNAKPDGVVSIGPMLTRVPDWKAFLAAGLPEADHEALRAAERTGRPLGSMAFIAEIENRSGRSFAPGRAGRPRRAG